MKGKTCLESKEEGVILHLMSLGDVISEAVAETRLKLQRQGWLDTDVGASSTQGVTETVGTDENTQGECV